MKIKKLGLLTMLGSMAIVGVGSAVWKFSGSASQASTGTVSVATAETVGAVTLASNPVLTLNVDKESLTWTVDITPTYTATGATASDIAATSLTYDIEFGSAFSTYFTIAKATGNTWTSGTKMTTVATTLTWQSGKNPTTKALYDSMKTALTNSTTGSIKITFKATSNNGDAE